jgi:hypothetical protein
MIQSIHSHLPNLTPTLILIETGDIRMINIDVKGPERITITSRSRKDDIDETKTEEISKFTILADVIATETETGIVVERIGSEGDETRMIEKKKRKRGSDVDGVRKGNVKGERGRSVSIRMGMAVDERIDHLLWM